MFSIYLDSKDKGFKTKLDAIGESWNIIHNDGGRMAQYLFDVGEAQGNPFDRGDMGLTKFMLEYGAMPSNPLVVPALRRLFRSHNYKTLSKSKNTAGEDNFISTPQIQFQEWEEVEGIWNVEENSYPIINISGGIEGPDYWVGSDDDIGWEFPDYETRIAGAPYFLGFNTGINAVPEYIPLDTLLYTIWVPELTDTGRIYNSIEAMNINDVDPIKTEKIQTVELGFKGFITERIHLTADYYVSYYVVIKKNGNSIIKRYETSLLRKLRDFTFIKAYRIINRC